jgi:hypothetical protein
MVIESGNPQREWDSQELNLFRRLDEPIKIQNYLNSLEYDDRPGTRSPRWVLREKKANCFEGALFAAAALRQLGHKPVVVDMKARNDDDHDIAVFKQNGCWGAVAKSNFTTLRFREPVYRTVRELVMSYFDFFYNILGEKTMVSYSLPLSLTQFDRRSWMTADEDLGYIGDHLDRIKHFPVLTKAARRSLNRMDKDLLRAGLLGSKKSGLYKPKQK